MQLDIRAIHFSLNEVQREHIDRRLERFSYAREYLVDLGLTLTREGSQYPRRRCAPLPLGSDPPPEGERLRFAGGVRPVDGQDPGQGQQGEREDYARFSRRPAPRRVARLTPPKDTCMAADVTVLSLLQLELKEHEALQLTCLGARRGLTAKLHVPELNRPGLALGGFFDNFAFQRVQVFGRGESAYLRKLAGERSTESLERMVAYDIPCSVFTHGIEPTDDFLRLSEAAGARRPVHAADHRRLHRARGTHSGHDVCPLGAGARGDARGVRHGRADPGPSGVGKSEAALALVERGHRLVADDVVDVRLADNVVHGSGTRVASHHMEIRGLGIINISYLFGVGAILDSKNIQLVVRLEDWDNSADYDRVGLDERTVEFLGVGVREVLIPVRPGRPIWILIETAAMNERLKHMGYYSAAEFNRNVTRWLDSRKPREVTIEEW